MYTLSHEYRNAPTKVRKVLRKVAELEAAQWISPQERDEAINELLTVFKELDQ
jgi:hypothetical protein